MKRKEHGHVISVEHTSSIERTKQLRPSGAVKSAHT